MPEAAENSKSYGEPYEGGQRSSSHQVAGEGYRSRSHQGASCFGGLTVSGAAKDSGQLSSPYQAAGEGYRSRSHQGASYFGELAVSGAAKDSGQLSSLYQAAGEVTRKRIETTKTQPPPAFIKPSSTHSSLVIGTRNSTRSSSSEPSTFCRFCEHDNGYDEYHRSGNRCAKCRRLQ